MQTSARPSLYTCLSPSLLHLYDLRDAVVVIIDVLRATSTIATALYNGASAVIPVDDVELCIKLGLKVKGITAGERDGKIAPGLSYGNSPFDYPPEFIKNRILVLTTTNGTRLLHLALAEKPRSIITGSFPNLSAVCDYLLDRKQNVILACAAWKNKINFEDTLFAGAVINRVKHHFEINCDSSGIAETMFSAARHDLYGFLQQKNASHYRRLSGFGLEKDLRYCLQYDHANILPFYQNEQLVVHRAL